MLRLLSGCAAVAARPPILMAMAVVGLFTPAARRGRTDARPSPLPRMRERVVRRSRMDDWERSSKRAVAEAKAGFLASCRRATPDDYKRWLAVSDPEIGVKRRDYKLDTRDTHTDRNWGYPQWVVAQTDIKVTPLHGAMAVNIIVPRGVTVEGDLGHSEAFSMGDGKRSSGYGTVDRYRNT